MRPLILGMATSSPGDPPLSPEAGTGRRLFLLSSMGREEYESAFDRRNLLPHPWRRGLARAAGRAARRSLEGRRVLVLGREVWAALGLPGAVPFFSRHGGFLLLPHPSGRNRVLNSPSERERFRTSLLQAAGRRWWRGTMREEDDLDWD